MFGQGHESGEGRGHGQVRSGRRGGIASGQVSVPLARPRVLSRLFWPGVISGGKDPLSWEQADAGEQDGSAEEEEEEEG